MNRQEYLEQTLSEMYGIDIRIQYTKNGVGQYIISDEDKFRFLLQHTWEELNHSYQFFSNDYTIKWRGSRSYDYHHRLVLTPEEEE